MLNSTTEIPGVGRPATMSKAFHVDVPDVRELSDRNITRRSGFHPLDDKFTSVLPSLIGVTDPFPKSCLDLWHLGAEVVKSPAQIASELSHLPPIHIRHMLHVLSHLRQNDARPTGCLARVKSNRACEATELIGASFDARLKCWIMEHLDSRSSQPRPLKDAWYVRPYRRSFSSTTAIS